MAKFDLDTLTKKTAIGSLGFRYCLYGYCRRNDYFTTVTKLTEVFGPPNFRYHYHGLVAYGLTIREGTPKSRWFAGPRNWASANGKNSDVYCFAFRSEKDRLLASMMI